MSITSRNIEYFPATGHEEVRRQLTSVVVHGSGVAVLLGGVGVGKTFLFDVVATDLVAHGLSSRRIVVGRCRSSDELLELVSSEVGVNVVATPSARRLKLREAMESSATPSVLFLDEVDGFTPEMLDEVRAWSDWRRGEVAAVRCVLAGTLAFDETLTHPKLAAFSQRIAARCYLESFLSNETRAFLTRSFGGGIWSSNATTLVHRLTDGVPRLVVQLATNISTARGESAATSDAITANEIQSAWQRIDAICAKSPELFDSETPSHVVVANSTLHDDADDINDDLAGGASVEFGVDAVDTVQIVDVVTVNDAVVPPVVVSSPVPAPAYVYQTTEPVVPQYPCYIDKNIAMLNWVAPGHRVTSGYATPYRTANQESFTAHTTSTAQAMSTAQAAHSASISSTKSTASATHSTSLDETFAESIAVTPEIVRTVAPVPSVPAMTVPAVPVPAMTVPVLAVITPEPEETVYARLETAVATLNRVVEQLHASGGQMERVVERAAERAASAAAQQVEQFLEETVTPPIHELIEMIVDFESALHQDHEATPTADSVCSELERGVATACDRSSLASAITQFDDLLEPEATLGRLVGESGGVTPRRLSRSVVGGTQLPLTAPPQRGKQSRGTSSRGVPAIRLFQDDPHRRIDLDTIFQPPRTK
ncbi:MAG: AAA family ATPase [Thermoguttaceae bacterium]